MPPGCLLALRAAEEPSHLSGPTVLKQGPVAPCLRVRAQTPVDSSFRVCPLGLPGRVAPWCSIGPILHFGAAEGGSVSLDWADIA